MSLTLWPVTLAEAKAFVAAHHRHHRPPTGWKFGVGVTDAGVLVGVAMVGRPVSRVLQAREPLTLEVTRNCTDGTRHAASMLYAACWRAAKALGYVRLVTYLDRSESGTSVKAAGWVQLFAGPDGGLVALPPDDGAALGLSPYLTNGRSWSCPSRPRTATYPVSQKTLWQAA